MTLTTTGNLVVNGDAESGNAATDFSSTDIPPGWTTSGSAFTQEAYSAGGSGDINTGDSSDINGGNAYFAGGPNAGTSSAFQFIDLTPYAVQIDAGALSADASGFFGGYAGQDDSMSLTVFFLAADQSTVIGQFTIGGVTAADRGSISEMLFREGTDAIPVGTRYLKVELDSTRTEGAYNDGYADNIAVSVYGENILNGRVLVTSSLDYRGANAPGQTSGIEFNTTANSTATFSSSEFSPSKISQTGMIVGDGNADKIVVVASANFDASGLTFQNWTAGQDIFQITSNTANTHTLVGSMANDTIINTGSGNATMDLTAGGNDSATGGSGNDTFIMGDTLTSADRLNGGTGTNTVSLAGDYSGGVTFGVNTIKNIQEIDLATGSSYKLITNNANVAAGQSLKVDGSALGSMDTLIFNGGHETDGSFHLIGGAGKDTLTGGTHGDTIEGGNGADILKGGAGADSFVYSAVPNSTSTNHDNITDFDALSDHIDISGLGIVFTGVASAVTHGALSGATFNDDLKAAIGIAQLPKYGAVLFTPDSGTLVGHSFIVIDANGAKGYQVGHDLVIELSNATHLASFGNGDFLT